MSADRFQCLSIRQPWAWAVCSGAKDIENRTWATEYRGPLAIQASAAKQEINAWAKQSKGKLSADDMPCGVISRSKITIGNRALLLAIRQRPFVDHPQIGNLASSVLVGRYKSSGSRISADDLFIA